MSYSDKLRDPRWQKKRLKILERDGFKCKLCNDDKTELHVHHKSYNGNPWNISDDELITLCKHCHSTHEYCVKNYIEYDGIVKAVYKGNADNGLIVHVLLSKKIVLFSTFCEHGTHEVILCFYGDTMNKISKLFLSIIDE